MGIKKLMTNIRVEVYPRQAGVFSFGSISGITRTDKEELTLCKEIVSNINRHVDNIGSVSVIHDIEKECEFCGSIWTEDSDIYNGGCCDEDEDEENAPKETK
jgi:hypothetical protein